MGGLSGTLGYRFAFFFQFPVRASQAAAVVVIWLVMLPLGALRRSRSHSGRPPLVLWGPPTRSLGRRARAAPQRNSRPS
jgi:hypothetical protein